jgi:hypothetical protein
MSPRPRHTLAVSAVSFALGVLAVLWPQKVRRNAKRAPAVPRREPGSWFTVTHERDFAVREMLDDLDPDRVYGNPD